MHSPPPPLFGAAALSDWSVIQVCGQDAATFLQGQLSNDIKAVTPSNSQLAAYCLPNGRIFASFIISMNGGRQEPASYWLACSSSMAAPVVARLKMFVLRSKVVLTDISAELALAGVSSVNHLLFPHTDAHPHIWTSQKLPDGSTVIRLPDALDQARWLWLGARETQPSMLRQYPGLSLQEWQWLEVRSGIAHITSATSGLFIPQMLNYEIVGGVDFKKGCYPGQEVVARSQYLGKVKRRTYLYHTEAPAPPGTEIYSTHQGGESPCGMVISGAPHPVAGWDVLAEIQVSASQDGGALYTNTLTSETKLAPMPMPYLVPHAPSA